MATPSNVLGEIERTYLLLEQDFQRIYGACTTSAQRTKFVQEYNGARDAYWKAVGETLADMNSKVDKVRKELKEANADIAASLKGLKDIVALLDVVSSAVSLAGSLVTLAAA